MSNAEQDAEIEFPRRFTLLQAFYWTSVAALLASAYAEGGVDGFCSGIFLLPTAFVLFGLFWRDRGVFLTSVLLQVCCIPWMLPSLGHPGKYDNSTCLHYLKNIGVATHNYFDLHKTLPERCEKDGAKRPLLSWRVTLLPYLPHR